MRRTDTLYCRSKALAASNTARQSRNSKFKIPNSRGCNENDCGQKSLRATKKFAHSSTVCLVAAICSLCSGGLTSPGLAGRPPFGEVNSPLRRPLPPCITESAFFKSLPKSFQWPDPGDALGLRVLEEYGAMFVARGVVRPPTLIFPSQAAVARWQASLSTEQAEIAGVPGRLQSAAMRDLIKARQEAFEAHAGISPAGYA